MADSRRVAALVEYDGTDYSGWQSQTHSASIQDAIQDAISFVAGERITAVCAGRTDRGVHAIGQVIHFDTSAMRTPRAWVLGANTRLPPAISLQWAGAVETGFHARHAATRRVYRYFILNRSARSGLQRARAAWVHRALDADAMHAAAQALLGEHDFSAFRSVECQSKTPVRRVAAWRAWNPDSTSPAHCSEIAGGSLVFAPRTQARGVRTAFVSKWMTWPIACTPRSVRPAQIVTTLWPATKEIAS